MALRWAGALATAAWIALAVIRPAHAEDAVEADRRLCADETNRDGRTAACDRLLAAPDLPATERAWVLAARARTRGTAEEALADLDEAVRLDPNRAEWHDRRANLRFDLGDNKGALEDESAILAIDPGNLVARRAHGVLLMRLQRNQEAIADWDAIVGAEPKNGSALALRGIARWRSLGTESRGAPGQDDGFALLQRAACREIHAACPDVDQALADLGRAIDLTAGEERASALVNRGGIRAARGDVPGALADLDTAIRMFPDRSAFRIERARIRSASGDDAGARADLDEALARQAHDPDLLIARAELRRRTGDTDGARADVAEALAQPEMSGSSNWHSAALDLKRSLARPGDPGFERELTGLKITGSGTSRDASGQITVWMTLDPSGASRFGDFTSMHIGEVTQIVVDGTVVAQPRILSPITGGSLVVSGGFSPENAAALARRLSAPDAAIVIRLAP